MVITRVYVDTSVFGGIQDDEFAADSRRFFKRVHGGEFKLLLSTVTYDELQNAPAAVRRELDALPGESMEDIRINDDMQELAEAYISAGILGRSSEFDALHVAAATVADADLILSWNFRHIVNYDRIRKFNAVNLLNGYRTLDIRSPSELAYGDQR